MNPLRQLFKTVLFLSILILIGFVAYLCFQFIEVQFAQLSPANKASLSIVVVLTLVCCFIFSWVIYKGVSRASSIIHPERRIAYDMFMELFIEGEKIIRDADDIEYRLKLSFLKQNMVLWASEKVLMAFMKWIQMLNAENRDNKLFEEMGETVLVLIRQEINKDSVRFKKGDIIEMLH